MNDTAGHWAIVSHTNSMSARAKRWYYVTRVVQVDGKWWELYRHPLPGTANRKACRDAALAEGLALLHGVFKDAPSPRHGPQMIRVL
jgi:hypothetical protein